MNALIPFVSFLLLVLSGCYSSTTTESQHIAAGQVFQTYTIDIDLDERVAACEAIFTITDRAGNKVALTPPASVTVNEAPMEATDDWGTGYLAEIDHMASIYSFVYTDKDGKVYTNRVKVPIPSIPEFPEVITPNDSISMEGWKDFGQFNSVTLTVEDSMEQIQSLYLHDYLNRNEMPLLELDKLAAGPLTITLVYDGNTPLQETTDVGGEPMTYRVHGYIKGVRLAKGL